MKYICHECGYIYDEEAGDIEHGIAPGTLWKDLPDDWHCPLCLASFGAFSPLDGDDATEHPY